METYPRNNPPAGKNADPPSTEMGEHLRDLKDGAAGLAQDAQEQAMSQYEQYRDTAADQLESLAEGARMAVSDLERNDALGISHYVADMAERMTSLADNLRGKSVDQLIRQTGQLARDNPALFVAGSVAIGFGLSRFFNATSTRVRDSAGTSPPDDAGYVRDPAQDFSPVDSTPETTARTTAMPPDPDPLDRYSDPLVPTLTDRFDDDLRIGDDDLRIGDDDLRKGVSE
ncbi:hypothetical protein DM872_06610 [Pseudomonas taiwanensis]|uniref:hypothetical protein n=1 Tax=Pseudomonas taiwanensis TaxID=470150 RepID=UPI0015BB1D68|nr:hypothetical protein [Pseudomonas taiwanensis]NWL76520.1 hypothetical protein [Pseudomonas taiwanensis]